MGRECPIEQPRTGEKPFIFLKKSVLKIKDINNKTRW